MSAGSYQYQFKVLSFQIVGGYDGVFRRDGGEGFEATPESEVEADPLDGLALCRVDQRWLPNGGKPEGWRFYENRICGILLMDSGFEVCDGFGNFVGLKKSGETIAEFWARQG